MKFISINETYEKAARNIESTLAVFKLTEILNEAIKTGEQRTTQEYVQYCVTVPSEPDKNKRVTKKPSSFFLFISFLEKK